MACAWPGEGRSGFLAARATGFFEGDFLAQSSASLLLLILIVTEAWWIHIPTRNERPGHYVVDLLSSAAIAGLGMAVALFVGLSLPG